MTSHYSFTGTDHEQGSNYSRTRHLSAEQPDYYSDVAARVQSLANEELRSPEAQQFKEALANARAQRGYQQITPTGPNPEKGSRAPTTTTNVAEAEPLVYGPSGLGGGGWRAEAAKFAVDTATELHRYAQPWVGGQGKDDVMRSPRGQGTKSSQEVKERMERSTMDTEDREIKSILALSNLEAKDDFGKEQQKWRFYTDPTHDARRQRARRMGLLPKRGLGNSNSVLGRFAALGLVSDENGAAFFGLSDFLTHSPVQTLGVNMSAHYKRQVSEQEVRRKRTSLALQPLVAPYAVLHNLFVLPIVSPLLGTLFIASMACNDNRFNVDSALYSFPASGSADDILMGAMDEEESHRRSYASKIVRFNRLLHIAATSGVGFGGAHGSGTPPVLPAFATPSYAFQTLLGTTCTPQGPRGHCSWTYDSLQRNRSFCATSSILSHPSVITSRDVTLLQRAVWLHSCEQESKAIRREHLCRGDSPHTTSAAPDTMNAAPQLPASLLNAVRGVAAAVDRHLINHNTPFPEFTKFLDEAWHGSIRREFIDRLSWTGPLLDKLRELEQVARYFAKTQTTNMAEAKALHALYSGELNAEDSAAAAELEERELEIVHLYGYDYFNGVRYGTLAFCAMALYVRFMSRRRDRGAWVLERCRRELELAIDSAEAAVRGGKVKPVGKLFDGVCCEGQKLLEARHIQRKELISSLGANSGAGAAFYKKLLIRGIPRYGVDTILHPLDWRLSPPPSPTIASLLLGTSTSNWKVLQVNHVGANTAPLQLASPLPMLCQPGEATLPIEAILEGVQEEEHMGPIEGGAVPTALAAIATGGSYLTAGSPVERSVAFFAANQDPEVVALRKQAIVTHSQRLHQQMTLALTQTTPAPSDVELVPATNGGRPIPHVVDHNDVTFAQDVRLIEQHLDELREEMEGADNTTAEDEDLLVTPIHPLAHPAAVAALKKRPLLNENLKRVSANNADESASYSCYRHLQNFESSFRPPFPDEAFQGQTHDVEEALRDLYHSDPKLGSYSMWRRALHWLASKIAGETTLETASEEARPRKDTPHTTNVMDRLQPGIMRIPRHPLQSIKILFKTPLAHYDSADKQQVTDSSKYESQSLFSHFPFLREKRHAAKIMREGSELDDHTRQRSRAAWNGIDISAYYAFPFRLVRAISQRSTRPFYVPLSESGPRRHSTEEEIESFHLEDDFYSKTKQRRAQQQEKRAQQRRELDELAASPAAAPTTLTSSDGGVTPSLRLASSSTSSLVSVKEVDALSSRRPDRRGPRSIFDPLPGPPTLLAVPDIQKLRRHFGARRLGWAEYWSYWRVQVEVSRFGPSMLEHDITALYRKEGGATDGAPIKQLSNRIYMWLKYPPFSLIISFLVIPALIAAQLCRWYLAHLRCKEIKADENDLFELQREAHMLQQVYGEQEEELDAAEKEFAFAEANGGASLGTLPFALVDKGSMTVGGPNSPLSQALGHDPSVGAQNYAPSRGLWWLTSASDSTLFHRSATRAAPTTTSPGLREVVETIGREHRREQQWNLSSIWSTRQRIVEGAEQPSHFNSKEYFDVVLLGRVPQYHLSAVVGGESDASDSPQAKKRKEANKKYLRQLTIMSSAEMVLLRKDQQVELIRRSLKDGVADSRRLAAEEGAAVNGAEHEIGGDARVPTSEMVIHRPTGRILPSSEVAPEQWHADPYVYFDAGFKEGLITSVVGTLRDVYLPDPAPRWVPFL